MLIIIQSIFLLLINFSAIGQDIMQPPKAPKHEHKITIHSDTRNDEYFWLRDKNWPNVTNKEILGYLEEENKYSEYYFKNLKNLEEKLFHELKARIKEDDQSYPVYDNNYYYYSKTIKDLNYPLHCRKKDSLSSKEEIFFDANILAKKYPAFSMSAFSLNKEHNLLAYSTDLIGEERYTIVVKDLSTNKLAKDKIKNTKGSIVWHQSENGFFYTQIEKNWRSKKVYYHKLGTSQKEDKLIYQEEDETYQVGISKSSDKKYLFISTGNSSEDEIWFLDITKPGFDIKLILKRQKDLLYSVDHKNSELYIHANDKGKNFRLVKVSMDKFEDQSKWQEIIAHDDYIYLTGFDLAKDYMAITRRIDGLDEVTVYDNHGNYKKVDIGEALYDLAGFFPTYESTLLRVSFSSLTTPASLLEYDFKENKTYLRKTQEIPSGYNKDLYAQERIFVTAKDGKKIPISLVYKKSLFKKDGTNPIMLYGYGSYGISIDPSFRTSIISLLDRGFVYAIAHIRGGDDLGFKWYEEAKFLNKKLTFTDFISASEHLLQNKYGTKDKFFIMGGSAGGMLVGVAINERPDLYKGAVALVPFVDVLNTMLDSSLPLTPGEFQEWGNPQEKEYYDYIKSYSPYDNIKTQDYPALFVRIGLTDPRVTYWEPAKFIAKLRERNTSENPIVFEIEMDTGHKGKSGRYDALQEVAKIYTFVLSVLKISG